MGLQGCFQLVLKGILQIPLGLMKKWLCFDRWKVSLISLCCYFRDQRLCDLIKKIEMFKCRATRTNMILFLFWSTVAKYSFAAGCCGLWICHGCKRASRLYHQMKNVKMRQNIIFHTLFLIKQNIWMLEHAKKLIQVVKLISHNMTGMLSVKICVELALNRSPKW